MQGPKDARLTNGVHWLRGCMHCVCCDKSCGVRQCGVIRDLLMHMHTVPPVDCDPGCVASATCTPVRQLLVHYLGCMDPVCPLCAPIYAELIEGVPQQVVSMSSKPEPVQPEPVHSIGSQHWDPAVTETASSVPTDAHTRSDVSEQPEWIDTASSGWGTDSDQDYEDEDEDEAEQAMEVSGSIFPGYTAAQSPSQPDLKTSECVSPAPAPQVNEQLISFAQFLIQSLLRWPAADADQKTGSDAGVDSDAMVSWESDPNTLLWAGRQLWVHLLHDCDRDTDLCTHPGCNQARQVMLHMLTCEDSRCGLCVPVRSHFAPEAADALPVLQQADHQGKAPEDMNLWLSGIKAALEGLRL